MVTPLDSGSSIPGSSPGAPFLEGREKFCFRTRQAVAKSLTLRSQSCLKRGFRHAKKVSGVYTSLDLDTDLLKIV